MDTLRKAYRTMHKISNIFSKILVAIIVAIILINLLSVLMQIANRHIIVRFMGYSISWTEELARFSMIWFAYLTLPLCLREGSMAQLDMLYDRVGERSRLVLYLMSRLLMIIFLVIVVYFGVGLVESRWNYMSSMLHLPGYLMYSAPVISCILMGYEVLTELLGVAIKELVPFSAGEKRNFPEHEEPEVVDEFIEADRFP